MICKLCAVIAACLILGSLCWIPVIRSGLESKFGTPESMEEKRSLNKKLLRACLLISVFEVVFIVGAALWIGLDRIFDNGNFTAVVWAAVDGPMLYLLDWTLKRKVKNQNLLTLAIKLVAGMMIIVSVACILPYFGFAGIFRS